MQFAIGQQDLSQALNNLVRNTNDKFDAYKNIQIECVNENKIKLLADDGINKLEYELDARNVVGEPILINAKRMTDIVNKLSDIIEFYDNKFICGKIKIKVDYINQQIITPININTEQNAIKINVKEFKNVIKNRLYVFEGKAQSVLSNLCVNDNEIVSTNGNVLSIGTLENGIGQQFLLSQNLANEILKDFSDDEEINMIILNNKIIIWNDKLKIESSVFDGIYPPYKQLLPVYNNEIKINKNELLKNLDIMSLVVEYTRPVIKLLFKKDNTLTLETKDGQIIMDIEGYSLETDEFEIFFNVHYLINALKNTNCENIIIQLGQSLSPAVFKGDIDYNLIMPMQV